VSAPPAGFDPRGRRIGVVVVAYNNESRIMGTLARIPHDVWKAVEVLYIIDDCSQDATVERAMSFDQEPGKTVVLRNRMAQQYGGSQKLGYQQAIDRGLDLVVLLHADGQYAPERMAAVLEPLVRGEADVVIGSRLLERGAPAKGGMPRHRYLANVALTRMQNLLSGMSLSEFHSGYRAYRVDFLRNIPFWENADGWHFDTQILLQARQAGARIAEVPVPTYYGEEIRHVHGVVYGLHCLWTSLGLFLHRAGVFYSRKYDVSLQGKHYFDKFDDPASSHTRILQALEREGLAGKKVLELGVGDASLTRRVREAGAVIDGIEVDAAAAELARPWCRRVFENNLDDVESVGLTEPYDIVVAADVLEHLREPERVLSRLKKHLKVGGLLAVSLPNVANLYVRLNVLLGRFPYHSKGLLDRTHLHFYTLRSGGYLLARTGWVIESRGVTAIPLAIVFPFLRRWPFKILLYPLWGLTRFLPGLFAYQGLYFCRNPNQPGLV
jgi:2-polyprenyl-3-methyl-5-hydroxy-6-metoxy-1,4-benzoquinol methylase